MNSDETKTVAAERTAEVATTMAKVRDIIATEGVTRSSLERVKQALLALAARRELFPDTAFPPPSGAGEIETLFGLSEDPNGDFALYVYRPGPGKRTAPHNHATWAVVVGIEGEEPTTLWQREDRDGKAYVTATKHVRIGPGEGMCYLPEDIHSIAIDGAAAIKHLHLYGHTLLDLPDRLDFDPCGGGARHPEGKPVVLRPLDLD